MVDNDTTKGPTTTGEVVADATKGIGREFREASRGTGEQLGRMVFTLARGSADIVELGDKAFRAVGGLVGTSPEVLYWILEKIRPGLSQKLQKIPNEHRCPPPLEIAGPVLEGLKYKVDDDDVRGLFENLLTSAMDERSIATAHPRFVEIIKQMTGIDAKIFRKLASESQTGVLELRSKKDAEAVGLFSTIATNLSVIGLSAGVENLLSVQVCIDNFCALGLAEVDWMVQMTDEEVYYQPIINHPATQSRVKAVRDFGRIPEFRRGVLEISPLGRIFANCCIRENIDAS